MRTQQGYRSYDLGNSIKSYKSTDKFFKKSIDKSSRNPNECLACKHQQQNPMKTIRYQSGNKNIYLSSNKVSKDEYYHLNEKNQLQNIKTSKRYLEQLLEKNKKEQKQCVEKYQKTILQLTISLEKERQLLIKLQKQKNIKEAQNIYLANASLVKSYKEIHCFDEQTDRDKNRKIKQLVRRNNQLQEQITTLRIQKEENRKSFEMLQLEIEKKYGSEFIRKQYEAMKGLIDKMEEEKLYLLDRQHSQIQEIQQKHRQQIQQYTDKIQQLREKLEEKMFRLTDCQRELTTLRSNFSQYKNQQYQELREQIQIRDKAQVALQSKINCIESELKFVKGRYGYLLKLVPNGNLGSLAESLCQGDQFVIERVGRYNVSNGKQSIIGMNLSPIKRK